MTSYKIILIKLNVPIISLFIMNDDVYT